jgi:hypothetical protein
MTGPVLRSRRAKSRTTSGHGVILEASTLPHQDSRRRRSSRGVRFKYGWQLVVENDVEK